jgi:hypothetical protein
MRSIVRSIIQLDIKKIKKKQRLKRGISRKYYKEGEPPSTRYYYIPIY